jgi:hypothetical protein
MTNPKAEELYTGKRWVRIPDGTKVRFCEDGREGIIDGLTQLVVGPSTNPDSRGRSIGSMSEIRPDLAIEDDLLALTDVDSVVLIVKQKANIAVWSPNNCRQCLVLTSLRGRQRHRTEVM